MECAKEKGKARTDREKFMEENKRIIDKDIIDFISSAIIGFHKSRLRSLESLQFNKVLSRKNPYLFRAKNIVTAEVEEKDEVSKS